MEYKWKILEVFANDELITGAKYHVTATDGYISVESEGNYYFNEPTAKTPFFEVTEEMIAGWIEKEAVFDGENHIKLGLEKQINALKENKTVVLPWLSNTYTPQV